MSNEGMSEADGCALLIFFLIVAICFILLYEWVDKAYDRIDKIERQVHQLQKEN